MSATTDYTGANGTVRIDEPLRERTAPAREASQPTPQPQPLDRLGSIWSAKWWILLAAALAAGLTFGATQVLPKTYASTVELSLSASPVGGQSANDLSAASNNIAAQYAQVVTSAAVLTPAAAASGTSADALRSHTASGTLASQNIVTITVQAPQAEQAQRQADAIAASLSAYVVQQGQASGAAYTKSVGAQLAPLDTQIDIARKRVNSAAGALGETDKNTAPQTVSAYSARLASAQSLLTVLTDRRASLAAQASLQAISLAPSVQVLGAASAGAQIEPRPALYSLIAGLVGLVLSSQAAVAVADRRLRRAVVGARS